MVFHVLTLFPELIEGAFHTSITGRAAKKGKLALHTVNIRDYADNRHQKVDDYPYGGGAGMVMQAEPVYRAYESVKREYANASRVIYVTPQGRVFDQKLALEFSREEELVFLCGHYEGIDERVLEEIVTDYVSIGDYVLTGGELPALVMMDAVSRLVPGVLNNEASAESESFHGNLLEYPQYSRPEIWHEKPVPEALLSGDHRKINAWRLERAKERTKNRRPDLFVRYERCWECQQDLLKQKLLHMDMLEALRTDRADLFIYEGENIALLDKAHGICQITAQDEKSGARILEKIADSLKTGGPKTNGQEKGAFGRSAAACLGTAILHQGFLVEKAGRCLGLSRLRTCQQYVYTLKNPVSLRHKAGDVRVLLLNHSHREDVCLYREPGLCGAGMEGLTHAPGSFGESVQCASSFPERLETGRAYGAFVGEALVGILGIQETGALDFLHVKEAYRRMGIGKALEAAWINDCVFQGRTPFVWAEEGEHAFFQLQESLGLYAAKGKIWILTRG